MADVIATTSTQVNQAAGAVITQDKLLAAALASEKHQSGTGAIELGTSGCAYAYYAQEQGVDYLYRALPGSPSAKKWTFATRLWVPTDLPAGYTNTICWREGSAPGIPVSECSLNLWRAIDSPPELTFFIGDGVGYPVDLWTDSTLATESWHDIVVHYDSNNLTEASRVRIFVDAVEQTLTGDFPPLGQASWGTGVVPDPYVVIAGYSLDGSPTYSSIGRFADTLFLSGRNLIPAACHDYCGGYGASDWHLLYEDSAAIGKDSSGNGYTFTANSYDAEYNWLEPYGGRCYAFVFPVTLENRYRIDYGIPIVINVKVAVPSPTLGITLGTYSVAPTLPVIFRVYSAVTGPTLPIVIYSNAAVEPPDPATTADYVTWKPKVVLDGTDISAKLIGALNVEFDEQAAPVASFSFIPTAGTVDPLAWVSKPVRLSWQVVVAGIVTQEHLLFTGVVSDPTWSVDDRVLTLSCTGDMQSVYDRMTKTQVATQLAAASPTYSEVVFGDPADLSGWEYAEALISTTPYFLWQDATGALRTDSILPKVTADYTYEDDGRFIGSDIEWPSRLEMLNELQIAMGYRFTRLRSRAISVSFRPWQLETPYMWLSCEGGWDLPQRDQIASAAESGGWYPTSDITYVDVWLNGSYGTRGCSGSFFQAGVSITDEVRDTLCVGANWDAARRWTQKITETATLVVKASESQVVVGVLADNESYGYESEYDDEDWEGSLENEAYSIAGMTAMASGDYKRDLDADRAIFTAAQTVAINKARNDILRSHRGTTFTYQTVLQPQLDLSHTVHVDCDWVECQGKVRRVTHRLDMDSGDATSEISVALFRHNGAGLVSDTPVAATEKAADPTESAFSRYLQLGMYIGGRDDCPEYDEDWTGYIVNMPPYESASTDPVDRAQVWARSPDNPGLKDRIYPEGFHMRYPTISEDYVDPTDATAAATFDVAVPEDLLVLTSG